MTVRLTNSVDIVYLGELGPAGTVKGTDATFWCDATSCGSGVALKRVTALQLANYINSHLDPDTSGGTVTSISAGSGLGATPNPITGAGSIFMVATGVIPGAYTNPTIVVDSLGRITAAANGTGTPSSPDTVGNSIVATGNDRFTAQKLFSEFNEVLVVPPDSGVILPDFMGTPGRHCQICAYGINNLLVYPLQGQTFFAGGVSNDLNMPLTINAGNVVEYKTATFATVYMVSST